MSRKADTESFQTVTALLLERLRRDIADRAERGGNRIALEPRMLLWERIREIFDTAAHANLDRKLAFINAVGEARGGV